MLSKSNKDKKKSNILKNLYITLLSILSKYVLVLFGVLWTEKPN